MTLYEIFTNEIFLYPFLTGIVLAGVCALVSVLVILKRLAFIGQGITHAGFGGVGLATFFALSGFSQDLVVFAFCVGTGFAIAWMSRSRRVQIDTAIGVLLVAAMAFGILLAQLRPILRGQAWYDTLTGGRVIAPLSWDAVLFGNILYVGRADMITAIVVALLILALLFVFFKEVLFYTFDETSSQVFGLPVAAIHYAILVMLAVLIVLAMKIAGLILVNALLVIPGATATLVSKRLAHVLWLSLIVGLVGMIGGYLLAFQLAGGRISSPGPFIVLVLAVQFVAALIWSRAKAR